MEEKRQKKLELTNDVAFQRLFGMPGNERITKKMLEKLLKIKIEDLTLNVNKRMYGDFEDDKVRKTRCKSCVR